MTTMFPIAYASSSLPSSSTSPLSELHDSKKQYNSISSVDSIDSHDNSTSLFNNHELIGITITSIYFIFGFPTNLLSIIICCRSLFSQNRCRFWFLKGFRQQRERKRSESFYQQAAGGLPAKPQTNSRQHQHGSNNENRNSSNNKNEKENNKNYLAAIYKENISENELIANYENKRTDNIMFNRQMNAISFLPLMNKRKLFFGKSANYNLKVNFNKADQNQQQYLQMPSRKPRRRELRLFNKSRSLDLLNKKQKATSGKRELKFCSTLRKKLSMDNDGARQLFHQKLHKPKQQTSLKQQQQHAPSRLTPRSNPHRKCFELYLIEISVCDLIILAYNFIEWSLTVLVRLRFIAQLHYMEPILISKFMCRFIIALNRTVILLHNWLVASLALTRCYAIYKPLSSTTYFSPKFYYRLNLSVFLSLIALFSSVNAFGVTLLSYYKTPVPKNNSTMASSNAFNLTSSVLPQANEEVEYNRSCQISNDIYKNYKYIDVYVNVTLGVFGYSLPCLITLIINLVLIYNIRHMHLLKTSSAAAVQAASLTRKKQQQELELKKTRRNNSPIGFDKANDNNERLIDSSSTNFQANYQNKSPENEAAAVMGDSIQIGARGGGNRNAKRYKKNQFFKTTSSLLTLSFSYLICYIPYSLYFLLISLDVITMKRDIIFVFSFLRYLNHTLNFYIYFATGKRFRNDVKKFLGIKTN
jgi:hypothetical protein